MTNGYHIQRMRFSRRQTLLLAIVATLVGTSPLCAQDSLTKIPAYRARILGVFDANSGEPIEGAQVSDIFTRLSSLTTKTGTVSLVFLPDSGSMVRVQKIGYQPATMLVKISPDDTLPITMVLSPVATTLPTVVTKDSAPRYVSPGLRAMEERRKQGFGHFITEAELRRDDSKKLTYVIRTLPNINIVCPPTGPRRGECWAVAGRLASKHMVLGGSCDLEVYMNGALSTDNDLEKLTVDTFAGVEYYPGGASIPPQYNKTGSNCGVLLLWTRER
jgi:hypothetical protein